MVLFRSSSALSFFNPKMAYERRISDWSSDVCSSDRTIHIASPGHIVKKEDAAIGFEPLITTSEQSGTIPAAMMQGPGPLDPLRLTNSFNPTGEPYVLAARLHGQLKTAFPDGRPQAPATEGAAEGAAPAADDAEKAEPPKAEHLTESSGEANIIVVADVDMLADGLWVRVQDFFGQRVAMPVANRAEEHTSELQSL